jgi:hypothetical protein
MALMAGASAGPTPGGVGHRAFSSGGGGGGGGAPATGPRPGPPEAFADDALLFMSPNFASPFAGAGTPGGGLHHHHHLPGGASAGSPRGGMLPGGLFSPPPAALAAAMQPPRPVAHGGVHVPAGSAVKAEGVAVGGGGGSGSKLPSALAVEPSVPVFGTAAAGATPVTTSLALGAPQGRSLRNVVGITSQVPVRAGGGVVGAVGAMGAGGTCVLVFVEDLLASVFVFGLVAFFLPLAGHTCFSVPCFPHVPAWRAVPRPAVLRPAAPHPAAPLLLWLSCVYAAH